MRKNKYYSFSFNIDVNNQTITICGKFLAENDENAADKLPNTIKRKIGCLHKYIRRIILYYKDKEIRYYTNWEDMLHEISIA